MLILIGASASGKSNIAKLLIKDYHFEKVITTTTRQKRPGEINHIDYHFTTKKRFLKKKKKGGFLETVTYDNEYYGTPKDEAGLNKVLFVDPDGANSIYYHHIEHVVFFYLSAREETRKERMLDRGDTLIQIIDRLEKDAAHFKKDNLVHIDYIVDTSDESLEELTYKIAMLYHNHVHNDNQMSIYDVFRNDDRDKIKQSEDD